MIFQSKHWHIKQSIKYILNIKQIKQNNFLKKQAFLYTFFHVLIHWSDFRIEQHVLLFTSYLWSDRIYLVLYNTYITIVKMSRLFAKLVKQCEKNSSKRLFFRLNITILFDTWKFCCCLSFSFANRASIVRLFWHICAVFVFFYSMTCWV